MITLINSGASHNFVSLEMVNKIGLPIEQGKRFGVMVGNGVTVRGEGVCKQVKLRVQGIDIIQDFFLSNWGEQMWFWVLPS